MKKTGLKKHYTYMRKDSLGSFDLEIKLSTAFKLFFSEDGIPEELRKSYTGILQTRNYFDSFEELNTRVHEIIASFEETFVEETKKKVILYSIVYDEKRRGHSIGFNYVVAQRIDTGNRSGKTDTRYYTERVRRGLSRNEITTDDLNTYEAFGHDDKFSEMNWSKEREAWFEQMAESVKHLGQRLLEGFGEKPEILAKKIDLGGSGFLLQGKPE